MNSQLSEINVSVGLVIEIERVFVVGGVENIAYGHSPIVEDAVGASEFPEITGATRNVTAGWVSSNEDSNDKVTIDKSITSNLGGVVVDVGFSF